MLHEVCAYYLTTKQAGSCRDNWSAGPPRPGRFVQGHRPVQGVREGWRGLFSAFSFHIQLSLTIGSLSPGGAHRELC